MSLRWLGRAEGITHLRLEGAGNGPVHLEGSFDLENWFLLESGVPTAGSVTWSHTNAEPVEFGFYRAVSRTLTPPPSVGPQADPGYRVSALITPESGGRCAVIDSKGIHYELTVRSNLVSEPVMVAMTVVTNFTALPFGESYRAAVMFEPDGLEFRGAAELRIQFPEPTPEWEMVGYGFDAAGDGFHLTPWTASAHEVVVPVSHFSGAGVAAVPLPPAAQPAFDYESVRRSTRDAERAADQWAGKRYRELSEQRQRGEISAEEFRDNLAGTKGHRDKLFFLMGIRPLLEAATRDCDVGELVLNRLDRLESGTGGEYGRSTFFPELLRLAPLVRCACAREYVHRCESDPGYSGQGARQALSAILDTAARITGRTDAQGCELGTDTEIDRRYARAACHKPWEGSVRYSELREELYSILPEEGSRLPSFTVTTAVQNTESYTGTLETLLTTEGDVPDRNGEGGWTSWKFSLRGKLTGSRVDSRVAVTVTEDYTATEKFDGSGYATWNAPGTLSLRLNDGTNVGWVEFSAGLDGVRYPMPLFSTTETIVECKPLRERFCPDSVPSKTKADGSRDISFAVYGTPTTQGATITYANGKLNVSFLRVRRDIAPKPLRQTNLVVESWSATLRRSEAP